MSDGGEPAVATAAASAEIGQETPAIAAVGVIGAGQMGNGIAHVAALAGFEVTMLDVKPEAVEKALATIRRNMDRQIARKTITDAGKEAAIGRLHTATSYEAFSDCDIVIEATTEKEEIKRTIFKGLSSHLKPTCLIASNTSSISITRLAAATDRPGQFIGMHFMNPVPVMKLVEIIRGLATNEASFQAVQALAARMAKTTAVAEDFPAFIVNRILMPMVNEAV